MHSFQFHIPDFNTGTFHFSKTERHIYFEMILAYYDAEEAFEDDFEAICRRVRAQSEEEKTAVEQVLLEKFILLEDGHWHHIKCDLVIDAYKELGAKKSKAGKASAEARAKKSKASKQKGNKKEQVNNTSSTGVLNQKPETRNELNTMVAECLDYFNQKAGKQFRNAQKLGERIKEYSAEEVKQVIDYKVQDWKGDPKMEKYLRPETLFNKTKFESYLNDAKSNLPTQGSQENSGQRPSSSEAVSAAIQAEIARQGADS